MITQHADGTETVKINVDQLSRIIGGLLASGHYTVQEEGFEGEAIPYLLCDGKGNEKVVHDAINVYWTMCTTVQQSEKDLSVP